jgi:broad specificity phosphatase PhoE
MEIVLARHGRPKFHHGDWIAPRDLGEWIARYNAAGIGRDEPTAAVMQRAASARIISSQAPRCVESARRLARDGEDLADDIFREAELPHPLWPWPKLHPALWVVLFRLAWFCGFGPRVESYSNATLRARAAAEKLMALAQGADAVLLVGHGVMNSLIGKQLLARGARGPTYPQSRYWDFSVYRL